MIYREPRFLENKQCQNYAYYSIQKYIKGTFLDCSVKCSLSIDSCGKSKKGPILLHLQDHSSGYGMRSNIGDNQKHVKNPRILVRLQLCKTKVRPIVQC